MRLFNRRKPDAAPDAQVHGPSATEADIRACFRLLLGRDPNPEEWQGHSARAGEPLERVVASYLGSLEFSRRGLLAVDHTAEAVLSELPEFRIYTAAADSDVGRSIRGGDYEPDVTAIFRRFLRPGMGVVDIGANVGWFTMLSARLVGPAGFVLAMEPNPANARLLEASRRANGFDNVTLSQTAAGRATGLLVLNTFGSNGTTAPASDDLNALLGAQTVPCLRVDALVEPGRQVDFIKADVEGAEYTALLGAEGTITRCRPVIVSEFSPNAMPDISGVTGEFYLQWLIGLGYDLSVIEHDGSLTEAGQDWACVMRAHAARGVDHIDIVATPHDPSSRVRG